MKKKKVLVSLAFVTLMMCFGSFGVVLAQSTGDEECPIDQTGGGVPENCSSEYFCSMHYTTLNDNGVTYCCSKNVVQAQGRCKK